MRNPLKFRTRGQVNQALLVVIRKELEDKYSRPQSEKDFIHCVHARAVMSRERVLKLLGNLPWYDEDDRDMLWRSMSLVFCILITINFTAWEDFKSIFFGSGRTLDHPHCNDQSLPLKDKDGGFLPDGIKVAFLRTQYIFTPIVIEKGSHKEYDVRERLPILEAESIEANGSQGEVDRVWIEKGYLETDSNTHNTEKQVMARKTITTKTRTGRQNFATEKNNLEAFKKSLVNHRNIMQSFATFVQGSEFTILSQWAEGRDLHQFLYNPDQVLEDYPARSYRFTPHNLLMEAFSLAEALRFLHSGMSNARGVQITCAHLDLKPENILVCFPHNASLVDFPVGQWKISDFGLSNVEESVAGGKLVAIPASLEPATALAPGKVLHEMSVHPAKRGAGPFQPPEVRDSQSAKVSTARDVWSFGCILFMILAFSLGGPEEVRTQLQCRSGGADDYFYRRERGHNPWRATEHASIKPELITWLDGKILSHSKLKWVKHCYDIILNLLDVDVVQRPSMIRAVDDLSNLLTHTEREPPRRIWGFDESTYAPEAISRIPVLVVQPDQDRLTLATSPPFVGALADPTSTSVSPVSRHQFSRGSPSVSTWFQKDPSSSYLKVEVPARSEGATLCSTAKKAAFWNESTLHVYNLAIIDDESEHWWSSPSGSRLGIDQLGPTSRHSIPSWQNFVFQIAALAGPYLATIQFQPPSMHLLNLYVLSKSGEDLEVSYKVYHQQAFHIKPLEAKLSVMGHCLVRLSDTLHVITPQGSIPPITLGEKEAVAMEFVGDGSAFCLWERDAKAHYWSIWRSDFKLLGNTIDIPHKWHDRPAALEAYLIPFRDYSRFIACDRQGDVYLVRADQTSNRVSSLGETNRVVAGLMSPDDNSFVLVRASQRSNQRVQQIVLSSMNDVTSFKAYDRGKLPKDFQGQNSGIAIRSYEGTTDTLCLITALPNGVLTRKVF